MIIISKNRIFIHMGLVLEKAHHTLLRKWVELLLVKRLMEGGVAQGDLC